MPSKNRLVFRTGEVYRGRDTKLNRDVALKILPTASALDHDRLARFRREAQVLASLNHQHIAAIYGNGAENRTAHRHSSWSLLIGLTYAYRIAQSPIPLDEVLPIAKQIAIALEAAHEQGVIHRDLKPVNIKLRPDGDVKVLDFGRAKALEPASGARSDVTAPSRITTPGMTGMGRHPWHGGVHVRRARTSKSSSDRRSEGRCQRL